MQRYGYFVAILLLSAPAAAAPGDSSYFGPLGRMGYQAGASDGGEDPDSPVESNAAGNPGLFNSPGNMAGCATCSDACGALDDSCLDSCCSRPSPFWGRVEAIGFWVRGSQAPPLLTTSPTGTPTSSAGVLPGATILYPTSDVNGGARPGGRFTGGFWCDECQSTGFDASFFILTTPYHNYSANSSATGSPILARPFYNTALPGEDAALISYPGLYSGNASITTTYKLSGGDVNFRKLMARTKFSNFYFLMGYRYLSFDDALLMNTSSTALTGTVVPVGTNFAVNDTFGTKNHFNGGQIGLVWQRDNGPFGFDIATKFAMGGMNQSVTVRGTTTVSVPNTPSVTENGGFLALGSNSGSYGRTVYSMIPELNANLNYQVNPVWRLKAGYTLMWVTQVLRASDQIDRNLNPAQFPPPGTGTSNTPPNPGHNLFSSDLWIQGISLGAECRF